MTDADRAELRYKASTNPMMWSGSVLALLNEVERLRKELDALQRFKDWVHTYLDGKGVPHHPPGTHGAEGCRIGDRMDFVFAERDRLRAVIEQHNLCHDLHGKVNCEDFAAGCVAEIKRIYGRCPWEEKIKQLEDEIASHGPKRWVGPDVDDPLEPR